MASNAIGYSFGNWGGWRETVNGIQAEFLAIGLEETDSYSQNPTICLVNGVANTTSVDGVVANNLAKNGKIISDVDIVNSKYEDAETSDDMS